jgi:ketosteroid isomerase-like protein
VTRRVLPLILFALILPLAAQQADVPQSAPPPATPQPQTKSEKQSAEELPVFDERAAAVVLGTIRDGLESHSAHRLLSAFDADKMDGYRTFQDQIDAYFAANEGIRVTLRILQTSQEGDRGYILAAFQLENNPRNGEQLSRREAQLRFVLERGPKGWKIVDFDPREFFS